MAYVTHPMSDAYRHCCIGRQLTSQKNSTRPLVSGKTKKTKKTKILKRVSIGQGRRFLVSRRGSGFHYRLDDTPSVCQGHHARRYAPDTCRTDSSWFDCLLAWCKAEETNKTKKGGWQWSRVIETGGDDGWNRLGKSWFLGLYPNRALPLTKLFRLTHDDHGPGDRAQPATGGW